MTTTMQAWSSAAYGPASGFRLEQVAIPAPGPGEVLLRVHATALNAGDVRLMLGDPLLVHHRVAGDGGLELAQLVARRQLAVEEEVRDLHEA